jgi:L-histidine Nalpha-methyltransferase
VLEPAYDDALGVTAAFNRNVLSHINRLIGSDFKLCDWQHRAHFNEAEARIEMHLQAQHDVQVNWCVGATPHTRAFSAGDSIHTENSYKYTVARLTQLLCDAGFQAPTVWTDDAAWFAVVHATA